MAVVAMNKLTLIGLNKDKNQILSKLMALGVVQSDSYDLASEESLQQWSNLLVGEIDSEGTAQLENQIEGVIHALDRLAKYNGGKKPLFPLKPNVTAEEFSAVEAEHSRFWQVVSEINRLCKEQEDFLQQRNQKANFIDTLTPWLNLDFALDFNGTRHTRFILGVMPPAADFEKIKSELTTIVPESYLALINHDKYHHYVALLCHRQFEVECETFLKKYGFSPVNFSDLSGTVSEQIHEAERDLEHFDCEYQKCEKAIAAFAVEKANLELFYDYLVGQLDQKQAIESLTKTENVFLIEGWLPANLSDSVSQVLQSEWTCVLDIREPDDNEEFPVLLENNSLGGSVEAITSMYGLPNCREIDPNTVMAPFFIGFFGLMLGDGGYGLVMALAAWFALRKFEFTESQKKYAKLVLYCGISTMFWGLMFGSWFGIAYFGDRPVWLNPVNAPEEMLKWSLLFGVFHVYVGIAVRGANHIRNGKYIDVLWDVVAWYVLFTGFILVVLPHVPSMVLEDPSIYVELGKKLMLVGGIVLVLTQGRESKGILAKLAGGVGSLYDLVSFLSDILSYSRLLALGLATSVIASIVNEIAMMAGLNNIFKIILSVGVVLIGHSLNFAINALGAYVHSSRLQYIEFFGKFYQSGGKPFKPLKYKTKYINLKN